MHPMLLSKLRFGALLGATLLFSGVGMAFVAGAAVYSPLHTLPPQIIKDFLADPPALLKQNPDGGPQMISRVKDLTASDPATLNAVVLLLSAANSNQATAIGTALAQVALLA